MRGRARLINDGSGNGLRRIVVTSGALAAAALIAFHVFLLARRLRDLSILQPVVALQWLGTLGILAFLWYLRRSGIPLFKGRSALAFWLLVLLLHMVPAAPATLIELEHADLLIAIPTTWLMAVTVLLGAALSALLVALTTQPEIALYRRRRRPGSPPLDGGFQTRLYARPPPARIA